MGKESFPSLHFKCINAEENIWSVRITRGFRAIGILERDTVTWFWIGSHDDYERFFLVLGIEWSNKVLQPTRLRWRFGVRLSLVALGGMK